MGRNNLKESFLIFLRGFAMGIADLIPGVSGGTIAFITGIYPRLIHSLSVLSSSLSLLMKGKFKKSLEKVDFSFFLPLLSGILIAIFIFSGTISYLLEWHPSETFTFFLALILSSAVVIIRKIKRFRYENLIFSLFGFAASYAVVGASSINSSNSFLSIFLAGMIAISAMLLPGLSGAFILLLFGKYALILSAIHDLNYYVLFTFAGGALAGLMLFSKLLDHAFRKFPSLILSFLVGLMLGSLRVPYQKISLASNHPAVLLISFVVGIFLVYFLHKFDKII